MPKRQKQETNWIKFRSSRCEVNIMWYVTHFDDRPSRKLNGISVGTSHRMKLQSCLPEEVRVSERYTIKCGPSWNFAGDSLTRSDVTAVIV
jgi:hypothetical protein